MNKNNDKKIRYVIIAILILLLLDQFTKIVVLNIDKISFFNENIKIGIVNDIDPYFSIDYSHNIMYLLINIVFVILAIQFIMSKNQFVNKKVVIIMIFIIAGSIGNILDILFRGYIINFITIMKLPTFNLANLYIFIGWISYAAVFAKFTSEELNERKNKKRNE